VFTSPLLVLRIGVDGGPLLVLERNFHLGLFHMLLDVYWNVKNVLEGHMEKQ
jgi:hypothetical protein